MMPTGYTRRKVLRTSLLFGAGILGVGKGYSSLIKAQEPLPDEEGFMYLELTASPRMSGAESKSL